jgi:hypothetical protein
VQQGLAVHQHLDVAHPRVVRLQVAHVHQPQPVDRGGQHRLEAVDVGHDRLGG